MVGFGYLGTSRVCDFGNLLVFGENCSEHEVWTWVGSGFAWFGVSCETSWSIAFFWILVNLVVWSCFLVAHVGLLFWCFSVMFW